MSIHKRDRKVQEEIKKLVSHSALDGIQYDI